MQLGQVMSVLHENFMTCDSFEYKTKSRSCRYFSTNCQPFMFQAQWEILWLGSALSSMELSDWIGLDSTSLLNFQQAVL
jgi:hypothetical protein